MGDSSPFSSRKIKFINPLNYDNMYTMNDWRNDREFRAQVNEEVELDIVLEMRDCVPPATCRANCLQVGEPYDHDRTTGEELYTTFERIDNRWIYTGIHPKK